MFTLHEYVNHILDLTYAYLVRSLNNSGRILLVPPIFLVRSPPQPECNREPRLASFEESYFFDITR